MVVPRSQGEADVADRRIIADDRERKSGIPELLRSAGLRLEVRTLPVADYIVGPETAVERKSIRDLVSSVFDGRLGDQCSRLRENFEHPVLVMEGNVDEIGEVAENPLVFYGAVCDVALRFRIPVVPTPSASHTAKMLAAMCLRREAGGGPYVKRIKKAPDLAGQQMSVLCSLPGVGEKFASRMLERFGTPIKAMTATAAELAKVEGLGSARARGIKRALGSGRRASGRSRQRTLHDSSR